MMKRLLINLLLCGLAASAIGAPLEARIKTSSGRSLSGALEKRGSGVVIFRLDGGQLIQIADNELASIRFKVDEELSAVKRQFDDGAYREVANTYNRLLPPFLPYSGLPSNLSDEFPRWMIASYWVGDYRRTVLLAKVLMQGSEESARKSSDFYRRLAQLDQDETEEMIAFMNRAESATLYPENSAARLYIQARLLQHKGSPLEAIRTITRLIARHSHEGNWMPKAELLCAELYFELEMPESAQAVLADIGDFYSNEDIQKKAAALAAKQK